MKNPAAVSARAALAALSLIAALSLARCFVGPGAVVPALAAAIVGDLTIIGATLAARRSRVAGTVIAVLGPVAVLLVPMWIILGGATTLGWPTFATWHVVGSDLSQAWTTFNDLRSPVPELAGLCLVGAWAVGGAALLAGWAADGGDTPLWVVAPPTAIFLFTSALGTASWRTPSIIAEVAALGWYAASSRAARRVHEVGIAEPVVVAGRETARRSLGIVWPAAVTVTVAALLAGFVGPHLPGATSAALVSLRDHDGAGVGGGGGGQVVSAPTGQIQVNDLVQVAQEEIYQSKATFFLINTPTPSYTILTTLDEFDGDRWTGSQSGVPLGSPLPYEATSIGAPVKTDNGKAAEFESQIQVSQLGGDDVPAPAVPAYGTGPGGLTYDTATATLSSALGLESSMLFDVISDVTLESPTRAPATLGKLSPVLQADVALPAGVPSDIVALAHETVAGATTDYEKAIDLQDLFQSGAFKYQLPQALPGTTETITGGEGLADLDQFLFHSRTGFCQQFASAFAVLARIDGLPTRIAVGFTPGTAIALGSYEVTGYDVHAWPQVYLGGQFGWWSFEPTPGAALPPTPFPVVGAVPGQGGTGPKGATSDTVPHIHVKGNIHSSVGASNGGSVPQPAQPTSLASGVDATTVWEVIGGLLVLLLGAAPVTRLARRRRRASDPAARVATAWSETAAALALVGLYQHDGETFEELARRVGKSGALPERACTGLSRLARYTTVAAYGPRTPLRETVQDAIAASREVCTAARHSVSVWRRGWAAVDPRGIVQVR